MFLIPLLSALILVGLVSTVDFDKNGYIAYCPCMGRFGNQADHFLGALAFSKGLNRTLILPPWVEYRYGEPRSLQVPFDSYFLINPLKAYHKVITMEIFMENIAPVLWPVDKRISFCYTQRGGEEEKSCNAKSGNPFGPFWDNFNVDFIGSEFYGPLNYDSHNNVMMENWKLKYPSDVWPVLAFTGAPASFPVQKENLFLQKYLKWSEDILTKSKKFIKETMSGGGFLGIHLRNGQDWTRACQHVNDSPTLFAAPQCVGYRNERGPLTGSMCLPQKAEILNVLIRGKSSHDEHHTTTAPSSDRPAIPGHGGGHGNGRAGDAKNHQVTEGRNNKLTLATFNGRTLRRDEHLALLEEELRRVRWHILELSEVRREREDIVTLESGHLMYFREGDQLLDNSVPKDNVVELSSVSSRVAYLVIKLTER